MAALTPTKRLLLRVALSIYRFFALRFAWLRRHVAGRRGTGVEERVMSGRSWDEFCDSLKAAGAIVVAPGTPLDPFTQAEGYRYLARLARAGLENYLECSDVECPRLCAIANGSRDARICIGSDNPDNLCTVARSNRSPREAPHRRGGSALGSRMRQTRMRRSMARSSTS